MTCTSPKLAVAALTLFPLLWGAVAVAALPSARPGHPVLVIGMPFVAGAETIVAAARGYPVGTMTGQIGRIAHSQDPGFLTRLRAGGPLLLLDAERLSFFVCGTDD